jgi:serine/threonine protein kinase/WD40 repeat protein
MSEPMYMRGREIARGGMGAVFETKDQKLGRTIAMKVMLSASAPAAERERFFLEARVLGRLAHPNIIPIHDFGFDEEGRHYYTMKLVHGITLHDVLTDLADEDPETLEKYSLHTLLTIFLKICDAVGFAHAHGIIHRDLKPQNIMVGEFGEVLVLDWGLAKFLTDDNPDSLAVLGRSMGPSGTVMIDPGATETAAGSNVDAVFEAGAVSGMETLADGVDEPAEPQVDAGLDTMIDGDSTVGGDESAGGVQQLGSGALDGRQLTLDGAVMGTPNFMSPEQAEGKNSETDPQSDIFSLGGVLYSILTLRPPVQGKSLKEILEKVCSGTVVEPTRMNRPGFLDKARAKMRGEIANPGESTALPHCPGGRVPVALSAVAMKALQREKSDRYPKVQVLARDIAAYRDGFATSAEDAGLLTLVQLFIYRHRVIAAALSIGVMLVIGFMAKVISSERRATIEALRASKAEQKALAAQAVAVREKEAQRIAYARAQTALGEAAIRELNGLDARELLGAIPEDLRGANWRYLFAQADSSQGTPFGAEDPRVLGIAPMPQAPGYFAFASSAGRIAIANSKTGDRLADFPTFFGTNPVSPFSMTFSSAGNELAVVNWDAAKVVFHNSQTGAKLREWPSPRPWSIEFHPTKKEILFVPEPVSGRSVSLHMYEAQTGDLLWEFAPGTDWMQATFHPSGAFVIAAFGHSQAAVVDANTGKILRELPPTGPLVYRIAASQDGQLAAFGDGQGEVRVISLNSGEIVSQFRAGEHTIRLLAFTPESERLVTLTYPPNHSFHHVRVWDAYTGQAIRPLLGVPAESKRASIHPYSGDLVVAGGEAKSWNLAQAPHAWFADTGIYPPTVRFWPDSDNLLLNDPAGYPLSLRLLSDGMIATNWHATNACGRNAIIATSGSQALIGGSTFDLELHEFHLLGSSGGRVTQRSVWELEDRPAWMVADKEGGTLWDGSRIFDAASGRLINQSGDTMQNQVLAARAGTNGVLLVEDRSADSVLALVDSETGKTRQSITNATKIYALAVRANRQILAEGGQDKLVRIRDLGTLGIRHEFRAHDNAISALALHPEHPVIATASEDLTIRLWNYEKNLLLQEMRPPPSVTMSLDFSPDGTRLVSAGVNGIALVWDIAPLLGVPPSSNQ